MASSGVPPLQERERRLGVGVVLVDAFQRGADADLLLWVAVQVADHADAAGVRQLDHHEEVRAAVLEHRVRGVPRARAAEERATGLDWRPAEVERVAAMADPL